MPLQIYNTLTRQKEDFIPRQPGEVAMYVCGVTPYAPAHVGHGRSAVAFDVVRRWLIHRGYRVTYVYNITDVEDKIIAASQREDRGSGRGEAPRQRKRRPREQRTRRRCRASALQLQGAEWRPVQRAPIQAAE